jgi:prevent-host-death family protein
MATLTLPIIKARDRLTSFPEELEREPGAITVTRHGEPVLAILPWNLYESIVETLEIMSDPDVMSALRHGIKEADEGMTIPWERVKEELEL